MKKTNGETSMIPRRYEIPDEQWEQIKDMFPPYQTVASANGETPHYLSLSFKRFTSNPILKTKAMYINARNDLANLS